MWFDKWLPIYQRSEIFWPSDRGSEETRALQRASGEKLKMKMIKLRYRDYPQLIGDLLDQLKVRTHEVDGEAEQMLTLWISPDGSIIAVRPVPARKIDPWIYALHDSKPFDEMPVDWQELVDELGGG